MELGPLVLASFCIMGLHLYWGFIRIMEKKMETTIMGLYWGYITISCFGLQGLGLGFCMRSRVKVSCSK